MPNNTTDYATSAQRKYELAQIVIEGEEAELVLKYAKKKDIWQINRVEKYKKELKDEQLEKVTGGIGETKINKFSEIVIGDVVNITGYIEGYNGLFCLCKISSSGRYKFIAYEKGAKYVEKAINITTIPSGVVMVKVGHDDQFVADNVIFGL